MSRGNSYDADLTRQVLLGNKPNMYDVRRTWLRHCAEFCGDGSRCKGQAGKIDLALLKGGTLAQIAAFADCDEERVKDHLDHLQEFWNGDMEPHHLPLKCVDGVWSFDV